MSRVVVLVLSLVVCGSIQALQSPAKRNISNAERVERWREDLRLFATSLRGMRIPGENRLPGQKNLAKLYPRFDAELTTLEAELPGLRNEVIGWRLARILASARVGHNSVFPDDPETLPLTFEWLDEGPVVTAASDEFKAVIGARLLKMADRDPAAILDALSPYLSFETEGWRRVVAGLAMRRRTLLELAGLSQDGVVRLILEASGGTLVLNVPFNPSQMRLISIREAFGLPVLLARSRPDEQYYWRKFLEDSGTLYVHYRQCADDPTLKFADFSAQVLAEIDTRKPRRVIVDLRFNQGGNDRVIRPLVTGLASRSKTIGAPFVLIGPITFSSGVRAAHELRNKARARIIGTPTGGLLGGYGEARSGRLSHSQFGLQWTTRFYASPEPVRPDITVVTTAADLRAGRDPGLEAAIAAPR